ncbi:glycosyltransferase [Paenibacillus albicereus]|uniref:Glycosyltransferase n=1 Tax=Paenibacillus albicereus TaxID=2726185 RepID=A0A6H2GSK8_9BACL|nr:glycosyltransferase family 2 protein [Paenibacillus albicereus]QJC50413.1 glycosyltransferase [Paenibacillus albicereus]
MDGNVRIGDLLLQQELITEEQLQQAIEHQRRYGGRLGDILAAQAGIPAADIERLTERSRQKGRLGEMLVDAGAIMPEQLERALEFQQKSGGILGDILLSLGMIEPDRLYREIATQQQIGRVGLEFSFEDEHKLPEALARRLNAVVINRDLDRCLVAAGAPLAPEQLRELEERLGSRAEQVLATREEMEFFYKQVYTTELMQESTEKLMQENPEDSAHVTFTKPQLAVGALALILFLAGLAWDWLTTLIVVNIGIQLLYLVMTVFKYGILYFGSKESAQLRFEEEEIAAIDERELPIYTILVPMYKESNILPTLMRNIDAIDYPKAKLDVRLLIEEDDVEAQELLKAMNPPSYYTVLVVPHSLPKTKPKACNYGLIRARGEYVVIYDAEDRPDPDQLKKVFLAFKRSPDNVCCVQAKLNYFNSEQNLLTRWFTHEYSMWFELLLPGVMKLDVPIPLGGTSNHFKTGVLKSINAWDPYNVTEDADLGVRLYKEGYKTAIVDSRTWEEATSRVGNWIRQRSRWIKGYMQTWLVHMRDPLRLWRDLGPRGFLGFQAMVLATPLLPLLNPIFWTMLLLWYLARVEVIPLFFPGPIYYFAAFELFLGNFVFVYSFTAGIYWVTRDLHDKGSRVFSYSLVKYTLLAPAYWVLMSIAAMKAAWQLVTKPFYWEKTQHGHATTDTHAGVDASA